MSQLRIVVVGLGPIGIEIVRALVARRDVRIVAAADVSPSLSGRGLAELVPGAPDVRIDGELELALGHGAEAMALCTSSRFNTVVPSLELAISRRVHVVSTCEEMAAPLIEPQTWARLDERARHADVTLLGTGVNPGFVMDRLPLQLAGACVSVRSVVVERVVDAARRRGPLRKKVGEGLTPQQFADGVRDKKLGHVGLGESALLIARGLGWHLEKYEETIEPAVGADGKCLGLRQRGRGLVGGTERISLSLDMYVGAPDPHDRVVLDADPPVDCTLAGGMHGDRATVATTVNALTRLRSLPRGFVTVGEVFA
jgi:4-hydroxy-tetrahydrodipicolinate reductase